MNIDIGGGHLVAPDFTNLDLVHGKGAWKRYAQEIPWPVEDNSVDRIRASHVMEHIPAGADRINVMNEAHRVLKPGGQFLIIVPLMTGTWHAIADPTHVSFWVKESFSYFDGSIAPNADYGIAQWQTVSWKVLGGFEGHWVGRKPQ